MLLIYYVENTKIDVELVLPKHGILSSYSYVLGQTSLYCLIS